MTRLLHSSRLMIVIVASFVLMGSFVACAGVTATNGTVQVTGKIVSVDVAHGSVTLSVQGQSRPVVINGLTAVQVHALQSQVGKTYTITATQNSDGSYTIAANTIPQASAPDAPRAVQTPGSNQTPGASAAGSLSFIGKASAPAASWSACLMGPRSR